MPLSQFLGSQVNRRLLCTSWLTCPFALGATFALPVKAWQTHNALWKQMVMLEGEAFLQYRWSTVLGKARQSKERTRIWQLSSLAMTVRREWCLPCPYPARKPICETKLNNLPSLDLDGTRRAFLLSLRLLAAPHDATFPARLANQGRGGRVGRVGHVAPCCHGARPASQGRFLGWPQHTRLCFQGCVPDQAL